MNSALRFDFDAIQQDQARLHRFVSDLDHRIENLGRRLDKQAPAAEVVPPSPVAPPPLPPREEVISKSVISNQSAARQTDVSVASGAQPVAPHPDKSPTPAPAPAPAEAGDTWELAFGTVWLARIGIVILITGLVFLGNYAWQHIVSELGAGGKLTLLYLAGALLGGIGAWLERGKESMRNYARVLMAGGAATIYYATYAAHYVERLRVIESPIIGGILLLGLAGGFIAWADRRQSQTVGMLAILLAYYTSGINPIGVFTLFSAMLLTASAVFFLVRHRWTALGWFSVVGTYGSYAFWRWNHVVEHTGAFPMTGAIPMVAIVFLAGYWLLFTAAAFLGKESALASARPALFITANNGAFFALAGHQMAALRTDSFWLFSLIFGAALLGLATLARWRRTESPALEASYLAQGLALVTLGLVSKLTGTSLALMLAAESALLLTWAGTRHGWLYQIASALTATAATVEAGWQVSYSPHLAIPLGGTVSAILLADAWWLKQRRGELTELKWSWPAAWFAALGLSLLGLALTEEVTPPTLPAVLAGVAVVATAVSLRLRLPELLLGQIALAVAVLRITIHPSITGLTVSPWIAFAVIGAALAAEQWWKRQRGLTLEGTIRAGLQFLCAAGAVGVGTRLLANNFQGESWILATSAAAIVTLIYGLGTRAWGTAVAGQLFTLMTIAAFVEALWPARAHALVMVVPVITAAAIGAFIEFAGKRYREILPQAVNMDAIARVYRLVATAGLALWGLRYIPTEWLTPFFAGVGALLCIAGTVTGNRERAITGLVFHGIALLGVWARLGGPTVWTEFLAILLVPASLRIARGMTGEKPVISEDFRQLFTALATGTACLWVTRWTIATYGSQGLTIAWSALALLTFAAGLGLRERVYRLGGFGILALAISRVFLVDVWRLETIYRILSFLVLGAVLLLLGFVYNRYAERIRRWL